jgi:hypothetical protein
MSTTVAYPGATPRAGGSNRLVGAAAAGLAVVIAIGFGIAAITGSDVVPGRPRPTASEVQVAATRFPVIGGETNQVPAAAQSLLGGGTFPVFGGASTQVPAAAQSPLSDNGVAQSQWLTDYQEYVDSLADRAQTEHSKQQAMWEQRYNDLVERFQNRYNAGNVIDDTLIGRK